MIFNRRVFLAIFQLDKNEEHKGIIPIPDEIKGWNWGAFFLSWIWGIGNRVWVALLALIFPFSLIMPFILGYKGNEWAWQKNDWNDIKQFKRLQRRWAYVGFVVIGILLIIFFLAIGR